MRDFFNGPEIQFRFILLFVEGNAHGAKLRFFIQNARGWCMASWLQERSVYSFDIQGFGCQTLCSAHSFRTPLLYRYPMVLFVTKDDVK